MARALGIIERIRADGLRASLPTLCYLLLLLCICFLLLLTFCCHLLLLPFAATFCYYLLLLPFAATFCCYIFLLPFWLPFVATLCCYLLLPPFVATFRCYLFLPLFTFCCYLLRSFSTYFYRLPLLAAFSALCYLWPGISSALGLRVKSPANPKRERVALSRKCSCVGPKKNPSLQPARTALLTTVVPYLAYKKRTPRRTLQ